MVCSILVQETLQQSDLGIFVWSLSTKRRIGSRSFSGMVSGLVLYTKRLERGTFAPMAGEGPEPVFATEELNPCSSRIEKRFPAGVAPGLKIFAF